MNVNIKIVRIDTNSPLTPYISGNKWWKLKYNIEAFLQSGKEYIITSGGAYSNFIVATAAAGKAFGIKTIGLIRGDELGGNSNPALLFAMECGMELIFISREVFKTLHHEDGFKAFVHGTELQTRSEKLYVIPEGGFNDLAVKGCEEIKGEIDFPFDYVCCACGTGATISGIVRTLNPNQQAIGFAVLRGESFLEQDIKKYTGAKTNWSVNFDYHFGGYAKTSDELIRFCHAFSIKNELVIEPIYTGKMFFGIYDLINKGFFKPGSTIAALHTGGTAFLSKRQTGSDGR